VTDGRTDKRTSCNGIDRAIHTRRTVKICSRDDPTGSTILRKPGNGRPARASACAVCRLCKGPFIATQLNSTGRRVELHRYKRALRRFFHW